MIIQEYVKLIETDLLPNIDLTVQSLVDPILVNNRSAYWKIIGCGNYAGVFFHPNYPDKVVKVYGRSYEGLKKEIEVYRRLGNHQAYSSLYAYGETYLILKKLDGITLFNAVVKGVPIPKTVIEDIDEALEYARSVGLNPFDVHGKNVVMDGCRGYVVDVSDFYKLGLCRKWDDLKKAYHLIYRPFLYKYHPPVPFYLVDTVRKGYRFFRKLRKSWEK